MSKQRDRCSPSKAVAAWHQLDDKGHMRLVESYLEEAGNFRNIRSLDHSPRRLFSDPLYAVTGRAPDHTPSTKESSEVAKKKTSTHTPNLGRS